ncbi:MAG TPA: shikimate dehydrogenase [Rhodanobacteraceae bacterium]|nr:shikimate dehydrogenase [Rhodanobacteraceae bacterium]
MALRSSISRFAVFGHPIAHSLSPRLHALFAAQCGIALEYTAIDAPPERFAESARAFFAQGGRGANVTLPDKRPAFELADTHTQAARRAGVANVLSRQSNGTLEAHNTDGAGLIRDLRDRHGLELKNRRVLLLGAGGAAQAVAWALLDAGVRELILANRTLERARLLADALARPDRVCISAWNALERCSAFDVIFNATAAGVLGAAMSLPDSLMANTTVAYDLAYGAAAQPFMAWARNAGGSHAFDGLGMLVETAADSFEHWHGVRPETDEALRALKSGAM